MDWKCGDVMLIPVERIKTTGRSWQVRTIIVDDEVAQLMRAIRESCSVTPITVAAQASGRYELVIGRLELEAVMRMGVPNIPAHVEHDIDDLVLMRRVMRDDSMRFPLRHIVRGWALLCLSELRAARGLSTSLADLSEDSGLDIGTISGAMKAGRALPEEELREVANEHGIKWEDLARVPRDATRKIVNLPADKKRKALSAASDAIKSGTNVSQAIRRAVPASNAANGSPDATKKKTKPAGSSEAAGSRYHRLRARVVGFLKRLGRHASCLVATAMKRASARKQAPN